jgi:hypothetical protein
LVRGGGVFSLPQVESSKSLQAPQATRLFTRLDLFNRESESSWLGFRATGAAAMVALGPLNLAFEKECGE